MLEKFNIRECALETLLKRVFLENDITKFAVLLFTWLAMFEKVPPPVPGSMRLEKQSSHTANFTLFLYKDLKVLINDSDSQQNSSSRPNCPQEVCQHRQGADTQTTKCSSCRDVPVRHKTGTEEVPLVFAQDVNNYTRVSGIWGLQELSTSEAEFQKQSHREQEENRYLTRWLKNQELHKWRKVNGRTLSSTSLQSQNHRITGCKGPKGSSF